MTQTTEDDRLLIEAAQADPARFVELYERYVNRIYTFVSRRTENRAAAEDITSQVFEQALGAVGRFEWRGLPVSVWLFRIASNALADHWRERSRNADEPAPDVPDRREIEDIDRRIALYQEVERLPDVQRQVIRSAISRTDASVAFRTRWATSGSSRGLHQRGASGPSALIKDHLAGGASGWLRCSSLKYSRSSRSSRLAIRAPRSAIWSSFSVDGPLVLAKRPQDANRALCRCECEPRTHPGDRPNGHILVRHESDGLEPPDVFVFSVRILFSMGVRRASQYGEERGHRVRNLAVRGSMDERRPSSIVFVNPASRLLHCPS